MDVNAFSHMVVADCLQRHGQRVTSARQLVSKLTSELESATTQLERALDDQRAFQNFVLEHKP